MTRPRRKRLLRIAARIIPLVFILLMAGVLIELYARWFYGRPTMHFGVEMWKYAMQLKIRAENAGLSHQHRPNSEAFLMGVDVRINSLGLRDNELTKDKPPGTYRIVVLGDSTTFGWGVPFEQLYTELLEKSLNANPPSTNWASYQVINTGIGNYNTCQELLAFKERWLPLDPDLVIMAWYINDAEPTPAPSHNWLAYNSYGYVWLTANLDNVLRNVGANQNYRRYYESLYVPSQSGWQASRRAFAELAGICRNRDIPLRILLIPELHTLSGNYEFSHIHDLMREVGANLGASVLDLIDAFPPEGDPKQYWASAEDAHPNGTANERMASLIDATLRAEQWIK